MPIKDQITSGANGLPESFNGWGLGSSVFSAGFVGGFSSLSIGVCFGFYSFYGSSSSA